MELALFALVLGVASLSIAIVATSNGGRTRTQVNMLTQELDALRRLLLRSGALPSAPSPTLHVTPVIAAPPRPPMTFGGELAATGNIASAPIAVPVPPPQELPQLVFVPSASTPDGHAIEDKPASFEERVALVWFTRIGAIVLLIGFGFFYNYAVDSGWLGPRMRVGLGTLVGAGILVGTERVRQTTRPLFVHVMMGAGLGILYLVAWASHVRFELVPAPVAFAAFGAITLVGGALALRARAELLLVFSLVGGYLAPVLLSSGSDRPLELFGYVTLLSSLALFAALRMRFVVAGSVAVGGAVALTIGWFLVYFVDNPAYADLVTRWPALIGTGAITAAWLQIVRGSRRHPYAQVLLLVALVYGHGCMGALLHDAPLALGLVSTALAIAGLAWIERRALLAIPMGAAAIAFACVDPGQATQALVGLGAATLVYASGLLRDRVRTPDPTTLWLVGGVSAAFACVAAALLLEHSPLAFAGVLVVLAFAHALLGWASGNPVISLATAIAIGLGMCATGARLFGGDGTFAAIVAAWAVVHVAIDGAQLVRRPALTRVATISIAAVLATLLAWPALVDWPGLALAAALPGGALLALGLRTRAAAYTAGTILLGEGIALVGLAIALQFSAPVTLGLWAALAATIVIVAVRAGDRTWLAGGLGAFAITLCVLPFVLDAPGRTIPIAITATALLGSAYRTANSFRAASIALAVAGHFVALVLLLAETTTFVVDPDGQLVATTLVLGGYAALLLGIGFGARNSLHRYLGLALFVLTIGKLALFDIWSLARVYQMIICLGVGALLVTAGFLYARFGRRLFAILSRD